MFSAQSQIALCSDIEISDKTVNSMVMIRDANITILTTLASTAFVLAMLGAISALWPHVPTEEGLTFFAFALAAAFAMGLGNLLIFGAYLLTRKSAGAKWLNRISSLLSGFIFVSGLVTSCILFTEGLNSWFAQKPMMPKGLIFFVQAVILGSFFWLVLSGVLRLFLRRKDG